MLIFEYLTFLCEQPELQAELTKLGLEGWRLHTCDLVPTFGSQGSGIPVAFVVMDRHYDSEDLDQPVVDTEDVPEGIAMKG